MIEHDQEFPRTTVWLHGINLKAQPLPRHHNELLQLLNQPVLRASKTFIPQA